VHVTLTREQVGRHNSNAEIRCSFKSATGRVVLRLLLLVLPRCFLILLNLELSALLIHALKLLNHLFRVSWYRWSQSAAAWSIL